MKITDILTYIACIGMVAFAAYWVLSDEKACNKQGGIFVQTPLGYDCIITK